MAVHRLSGALPCWKFPFLIHGFLSLIHVGPVSAESGSALPGFRDWGMLCSISYRVCETWRKLALWRCGMTLASICSWDIWPVVVVVKSIGREFRRFGFPKNGQKLSV